jgi:F0F1-type ATP synthase membrane subunit b/b'
MKTKVFTLVAFGFLTGAILPSCDRPQSKVENAKEEVRDAQKDLQKAENDYAMEVSNFKKEADLKISANKKEIDELKEERATKKTAREKEMYDERIAELDRRNDILRDRLHNYNEEKRTEKWESFKREFNHDMDELGTSIKDVFRDNKK